jgi:hypothetical protein
MFCLVNYCLLMCMVGASFDVEDSVIPPAKSELSRNRVAYHARLRVKYERVARYPWLPIDPDPPSPDGVTPPL